MILALSQSRSMLELQLKMPSCYKCLLYHLAINNSTNQQYKIIIHASPHYHPHYHPRETAKLVSNPGELTGRAAVYGMAQKIPQYSTMTHTIVM